MPGGAASCFVDLANMDVTFHAVESGEPIPLAPWD